MKGEHTVLWEFQKGLKGIAINFKLKINVTRRDMMIEMAKAYIGSKPGKDKKKWKIIPSSFIFFSS